MKIKKLALLLAAVVSVSAFAACGKTNKKTVFSDYWQYSSLAGGSVVDETLTYKVEFKKGSSASSLGYNFEYGVGSYVTTLKSTADGNSYEYTTELTMPVTYTLGDASVSKTDKITTEVKFYRADKSLKPISSKKTVLSNTPATVTPSSVDGCYVFYDYTIESVYEENGNANSNIVYNAPESFKEEDFSSSFRYNSGDYSYVDNEQLLLAFRAISSETTSGGLQIYNPFVKKVQLVKYTFATETNGEFTHTLNGGALPKKEISYREVSFSLDEANPGPTQKALIATHSDAAKNTNRNVILSLETPLSYVAGNLGSFVYTLTAVANV